MSIGREAFIKKPCAGKCPGKFVTYFYLFPLRFSCRSFDPVFASTACTAGNVLSKPGIAYNRARFARYGAEDTLCKNCHNLYISQV